MLIECVLISLSLSLSLSSHTAVSSITSNANKLSSLSVGGGQPSLNDLALIVDGISLEGLWASEDLKTKFVDIVQSIPTVIACRVSPLQKAALVRMVKAAPGNPVTLGIGDGANDVGMIHESRVGVGISGKEGRHAANAADFAIAQFRFVVNLLMEHGRFNYIRCSKLVLYSFFKNLLLVSTLFYYCVYSGFSGTIPLDSIVFSGYNFYLGLPILALGATDFDIPRKDVYKFPLEAYATGRLGEMLNLKNMAKWCCFAFVQGLLLFIVVIRFISGPTWVHTYDGYFSLSIYGTGLNTTGGGIGLGIYSEGFILYTVCIFAMQYKVVSMFIRPNWIFWTVWFLSFGGYFLFTYVYGLFPSLDWFHAMPGALQSPIFWLAILLVPIMLVISDYTFEHVMSRFDPSSRDLVVAKLAEDAALHRESENDDRPSNSTNNSATSGFCLRPISQSTAGTNHGSAGTTTTGNVVTSPMAPRHVSGNNAV